MKKVKVLNLRMQGKKSKAEITKLYGKNESYTCEIVKKENDLL
jgi:hypothetical protein